MFMCCRELRNGTHVFVSVSDGFQSNTSKLDSVLPRWSLLAPNPSPGSFVIICFGLAASVCERSKVIDQRANLNM